MNARALRPAGPGGGAVVPAETHLAFAALVYADPQWLRLEFDALVAASYARSEGGLSRYPPRRPSRSGTIRPPRAVAVRPGEPVGPSRPGRVLTTDLRARQRSPPAP